jgi:hypothetical protein
MPKKIPTELISTGKDYVSQTSAGKNNNVSQPSVSKSEKTGKPVKGKTFKKEDK